MRVHLSRRLVPALLLLLFGCGGTAPGRLPVYPVRGEVSVHGRPAAGAHVELHAPDDPERKGLRPHALVEPDGSFRLTTYRSNDGAPAGEYALTITWPLPPRPGFDDEGPDRLKGRYGDPRRPAQRVTIATGPNDLGRIDLK